MAGRTTKQKRRRRRGQTVERLRRRLAVAAFILAGVVVLLAPFGGACLLWHGAQRAGFSLHLALAALAGFTCPLLRFTERMLFARK
ncbi:MAG: hypothetical protein JW940_28880 [Polyangiaceae bacterium]|nr:hypothetical protein [Polyangiaceae bacterium]